MDPTAEPTVEPGLGQVEEPFLEQVGPPKYLFAQMDPTIIVGIENYYTGPT